MLSVQILLLVEQLSDDRAQVLLAVEARSCIGQALAPLLIRLVPLADPLLYMLIVLSLVNMHWVFR